MPMVDPINELAIKAWNIVDGDINSPWLPLLLDDWGIAEPVDFLMRLKVIRVHKKGNA